MAAAQYDFEIERGTTVIKSFAWKDSAGNSYPETAPIPGWHINLSDSVPELSTFEIDPHDTPARVFAGA